MNEIIDKVREALKSNADERTLAASQKFFKEKISSYGVKMPIVNNISKDFYNQIYSKSKSEIFALCEILWQSGIIEETIIACHWSYRMNKKFEPKDFQIFERWILDYVNNWATCDTFCNHTLGKFLEMFPEFLPKLKSFAFSDNRWMRRAAAVSLIVPAKKGLFLNDIIEIASILLLDKDDLVQKGYGWMLKSASQKHPIEIFDFVFENKSTMPRTALRYAIEKLPNELKMKAMER
jgi:3-methyladenine DNA glycosylase AlkD